MRRRLHGGESGQAVVLVAVSLVALLGFAGIVIDVGQWYIARQQAQTAADLAALAGAADLPGSPSSAAAAATAHVNDNVQGATSTVTTPYGGDASSLEVKVHVDAPTFFVKLLGIGTVSIDARAVARRAGSTVPSAVFAYSSSCGSGSGVIVNANNMQIDGGVHSNGGFSVNGNNLDIGDGSYGGPNGCKATVNGNNNSFGGSSQPTADPQLEPWPASFDQASIPCTYSASSFDFNANNKTIPAGVYCSTGTVTFNGNNLTGNITVVADKVVFNGNHYTLTPYTQDLLVYQTGSSQFVLNGNNYSMSGVIYTPNATTVLNGNSSLNIDGLVEGLNVLVNGNSWTLTGDGPVTAGSGAQLTE